MFYAESGTSENIVDNMINHFEKIWENDALSTTLPTGNKFDLLSLTSLQWLARKTNYNICPSKDNLPSITQMNLIKNNTFLFKHKD